MTTETTPVDDLTTAQREAQEAEALIERLEGRVVAGDESITAEEIESQRGLARFAKLRLQAAMNRAEKVQRDRQAAAIAALKAQFDALTSAGAGLPALDAAFAKMQTDVQAGVAQYLAAVAERDAKVSALVQDALAAGLPDWHESDGGTQPAVYVARGRSEATLVFDGAPVSAGHPIASSGRLEQAVVEAAAKAVQGATA